jgi:predicted metalloprotease
MRLDNQRRSSNLEDRRGARGFRLGGGGMRLPIGRGGIGLGGLALLLLLAWCAGINPLALLGGAGDTYAYDPRSAAPVQSTPAEAAQVDFVRAVLGATEDTWGEVMPRAFGQNYQQPTLVLFRDGVRSACGLADTAVGPFYCPGDQRLYLDLSFFDALQRRLGAGGDFARAYVIAHEVGHHVQNLTGSNRRLQALHARGDEAAARRESVLVELQADYFAGVFAHHAAANGLLEVGDYEEAIGAARAVGDDTLQRRATGQVMPEQFTHGSAAQRMEWFRRGYESGDPKAHDPFREAR